MVRIRLARFGRKKYPFYRIVVANSSAPRDGRFIEKIGQYNPVLPKDSRNRILIKVDRLKYWLSVGAQPTKRILWLIGKCMISLETKKKKMEVKRRDEKGLIRQKTNKQEA